MREIKFRAWNENTKAMTPDVAVENNAEVIFLNGLIADLPAHKEILMQYTGLTTADGTPIYEMDILEDNKGNRHYVNFSNGSWSLVHEYCKGIDCPERLWKVIDTDEVIGNIYENPSLLH